MCDFLIKQVAMENEKASSGRSDMLGTLSGLFNREDSRSIFSAEILGFLASSDSSMCAYALSYLSKCTHRDDGIISLGLLSDPSIIAALCKLLRLKISDTEVVESILRTLSFVLASIDTIDTDTWAPLFECFGASHAGKFSDKLGVLLPANSSIKNIAGDVIVSVLCNNGGQQLVKAPFFDAVFGCNSTEYSYSPLFCSLWLLKLQQRVSRFGAQCEVPVITGGCCGRMLAAIGTAAQRSFQDSVHEQEYQSPLSYSCGLRVAPLHGDVSLQPNLFRVSEGFRGTITPIILPSWDSLVAAMRFFNLPNSIPTHSIVCVRTESPTSCAVFSKKLFSQVSSTIDALENRTFEAFISSLGEVGAYTQSAVEICSSGIDSGLTYRDKTSTVPLSQEEISLLQTVFTICNIVSTDLIKSLSFDCATGKLVPEAQVMDFSSMKPIFQDTFSIFPKHLRLAFSNACIISTIKQNVDSPEVTVSRYLARRSRSTHLDIDGMSVFAQLMDYFTSHGVSAFCFGDNSVPFRVKFKGEDGRDAVQGMGGLLRECLSVVAEELSQCIVPVFIRRGKQDQFNEFEIDPLLLSPLCASTSRGRSCLVFLGVLMGVAMRSGEPLALDIHSSAWYALVGGTVTHPVGREDADVLISNPQIVARYINSDYYDPDDESYFEMQTLSGGETPLPVNNRMNGEEYRAALLKFANDEIAAAVTCVRQGLLKVVPAASLFTLSWQQLQAKVCGSSTFTFDELEPFLTKDKAISDSAFSILKNVLRSFSPMELSMFLRFCTGLLRLPTDVKGFRITVSCVSPPSARPGRAAAALNPDGYLLADTNARACSF